MNHAASRCYATPSLQRRAVHHTPPVVNPEIDVIKIGFPEVIVTFEDNLSLRVLDLHKRESSSASLCMLTNAG